jgi:hypothetical protein
MSKQIFIVLEAAHLELGDPVFAIPTLPIGGHAVAQLVEALRHKPEGHGFDSRWCHWNFLLTQSFRPHYGTGVHSASNRNEYRIISWG